VHLGNTDLGCVFDQERGQGPQGRVGAADAARPQDAAQELGLADVADATEQPGGAGQADAVQGLQPVLATTATLRASTGSVLRGFRSSGRRSGAAVRTQAPRPAGGLTRRYVLDSVLIIRWVRDVRMFVAHEDTEHSKCRTLELAYARVGAVRPL
jgi:hypothetical protein